MIRVFMAGSLMGGGLSTTLSAGGASGKAVNWQTMGPVFWCAAGGGVLVVAQPA
jgi:hypothetical protein